MKCDWFSIETLIGGSCLKPDFRRTGEPGIILLCLYAKSDGDSPWSALGMDALYSSSCSRASAYARFRLSISCMNICRSVSKPLGAELVVSGNSSSTNSLAEAPGVAELIIASAGHQNGSLEHTSVTAAVRTRLPSAEATVTPSVGCSVSSWAGWSCARWLNTGLLGVTQTMQSCSLPLCP